jgi:hypothetical protein
MAGSTGSATSGRIFISYRREETAYAAGWLYDRLAGRFGRGQIFKDVDSIQLGDDFVEVITRAVGSCDVLLALIGDEWLTITDAHGRRRLDNPDDFVRLEIEAALPRRVRVIPVLVGGARMPRADELPDSLAALVRRQALELSPARFDFDTSRLLKVLDRTLAELQATQQQAAPMTAPTGTVPGSAASAVTSPQHGEASRPAPPPAEDQIPAQQSAAAESTPTPGQATEHRGRRSLSLAQNILVAVLSVLSLLAFGAGMVVLPGALVAVYLDRPLTWRTASRILTGYGIFVCIATAAFIGIQVAVSSESHGIIRAQEIVGASGVVIGLGYLTAGLLLRRRTTRP